MQNTTTVQCPQFFKVLKAYIVISKPRLVALLFFTGFASALIASSIYGFNWQNISIISVAIILGVMGSNASTAYIDRDMDTVMSRTSKRPVPVKAILPSKNALIYGIILVAAGVVLGAFLNWFAALFIFSGFLDSAIIYNLITKKRTPLNILLGAPAGGMPVFAGWAAVSGGSISLTAVIMFALVMIWTPVHIWSLAYFYREDYKKAKVPMLPVIWSRKKVLILLAALNFVMVAFSIFIAFYLNLSILYIIIVSLNGAAILIIAIIMLARRLDWSVWLLFKFSSPYLGIIFIMLLVEYMWIK